MFRKLLLALALTWPLPAFALAPDGDWNGTLSTPSGRHLRLLFRFHHEGGALQARFISVDQAGASFPVDVKEDGAHLSLVLPLGASFDGTLAADEKSITGTFTQRGYAMALTLAPGTIDAPTVHQPDPGDLTVRTPTGVLAGTMIKKGPLGGVVLSGSGNGNRDGKAADNGGRDTYRQIALGLAEQGVSTLRFDKRGIGESASAMTREDDITLPVMAGDAKAMAAELKTRLGAPCVWLIGHSEGGLVALLAAQGNPDICGLVLLASPGRPVTQVLHDQFDRLLPAEDKPGAFAALDNLAAGKPPGAVPDSLKGLFRPSLDNYWRSQATLDPAALAAKLKIPMLILQGDADTQMTPADPQALARARPDASLKIEAGVNHSQRVAKDDSGGGPVPLAPGVTAAIAQFMKSHP